MWPIRPAQLFAMRTPLHLGAALSFCLAQLVGCRLMSNETAVVQDPSPLKPARSSPDSVKVEVIWARIPTADRSRIDEAWTEIDETRIEAATRRELAKNGLRAGIIAGKLPAAISNTLNKGDAKEPALVSGESTDLAPDVAVHGRVRQLKRRQRMEIQASEVFASLPLLVSSGNELSGRNYEQAQAIYALEVDPQPDSSTLMELTPELHYGAPRMQWTGGDGGVLHQAPLREQEVFERLRLSVPLAPGEMLVLMAMPESRSRLGQYFHTANAAGIHQEKLILIRLADIPPGNDFATAF
jgi:hypothetical protein